MGYLILLLLLLLLFLYFYYYQNIVIKFYNSSELSNVLKLDNFNYFTNMSDLNLNIRKINNKNDYTLSFLEKIMLKNAIYKAQNILNTINYPGFYSYKIKNIPWLIGCSKNKKYEFGFPHTRQKIIILNMIM